MRRIIVSLSLIAACATNAFAQEPMALSLQAAMDYAVKNNAAAKNARIDVLIQDAQNKQVTASALPRISGKGDFTQYTNLPAQFFPATFGSFLNPTAPPADPNAFIPVTLIPKYAVAASISGSQLLFDGSVLVALQARKTTIELAQNTGKLTEENLRYNVQRAYYALVIARRQLNILSNSLAYARDIAKDLSILRESGYVEKIEVDRTTVQINNLATDSLRISSLLEVSEQALKYQMGMDINAPIMLTDTSVESNLSKTSTLVSEPLDYNKRTEYNVLQANQKLNGLNLKRYRMAALPSLVLIGNMGYNNAPNRFSDIAGTRYVFSSLYGLQLNVPIFSGFQRINQVREAKLNIEKTQNNIENLKLTIDFQTEQSRTTLKNSLLQLESQQRNLTLASTVLDLARKKYKAGVGSNIEVSQAQTELLNTQNNYFNSLLDVVNAQSDLQKALGNFK